MSRYVDYMDDDFETFIDPKYDRAQKVIDYMDPEFETFVPKQTVQTVQTTRPSITKQTENNGCYRVQLPKQRGKIFNPDPFGDDDEW